MKNVGEDLIILSRETVIQLIATGIWVQDEITSVLKPFDLSIQQFNVLRILRGQKGVPANLSTINERMITKMSNTTRLVDKLIIKNYVERKECPQNRRKVEITIREEGLDVLKTLDPIMNAQDKLLVSSLSPNEIKDLNTLLHKIKLINKTK